MHANTSGQNEIWSRLWQRKYILWSPPDTHINWEDRPSSNRRSISIFYGLQTRCSIYTFSQNTLSNKKWYEQLNTKIYVVWSIGVTQQHQVFLSHVVEESNKKFEDMTPEEKKTREDAEEFYLSYIFIRQSGKHHNKLKTILKMTSLQEKIGTLRPARPPYTS